MNMKGSVYITIFTLASYHLFAFACGGNPDPISIQQGSGNNPWLVQVTVSDPLLPNQSRVETWEDDDGLPTMIALGQIFKKNPKLVTANGGLYKKAVARFLAETKQLAVSPNITDSAQKEKLKNLEGQLKLFIDQAPDKQLKLADVQALQKKIGADLLWLVQRGGYSYKVTSLTSNGVSQDMGSTTFGEFGPERAFFEEFNGLTRREGCGGYILKTSPTDTNGDAIPAVQ